MCEGIQLHNSRVAEYSSLFIFVNSTLITVCVMARGAKCGELRLYSLYGRKA